MIIQITQDPNFLKTQTFLAALYHNLPPAEQAGCMLYGGSYQHAGSINYFRSKYKLPKTYSLNGSYVFWANAQIQFDTQILVDDVNQDSSQWFNFMVLVNSIQNPNAREKGYIYYRKTPKQDVVEAWKALVHEVRGE